MIESLVRNYFGVDYIAVPKL